MLRKLAPDGGGCEISGGVDRDVGIVNRHGDDDHRRRTDVTGRDEPERTELLAREDGHGRWQRFVRALGQDDAGARVKASRINDALPVRLPGVVGELTDRREVSLREHDSAVRIDLRVGAGGRRWHPEQSVCSQRGSSGTTHERRLDSRTVRCERAVRLSAREGEQ